MSALASIRSNPQFSLNERLTGFSCIRCNADLPIADYYTGCPSCAGQKHPAMVRSVFAQLPDRLAVTQAHRMERFAEWMPYSSWVSLGEGGTSCVGVPRLATEAGAAAIFLKNEGQNPTGSHKDRVSCLTVTRALASGATKIVAASSGNGGASLALYAAAAGLRCSIVVTPALSPIHRRAIAETGADLIEVADSLDRWGLVADMVKVQGWFPATNYLTPPVGSNHFGIEGLKSIAFELFEDIGAGIDVVLVPTSRGDLVWGIYEGFRQLQAAGQIERLPRLFVVEPFARVGKVLGGADPTDTFPGLTALFSLGGSTVTYQAVEAVRATDGGAVSVDDDTVRRDAARLARHGCYAELSAAATLTALDSLIADGTVAQDATVALIITSNGYKDRPDTMSGA